MTSASAAIAKLDRPHHRDSKGLWFWAAAASLTLHLLALHWLRAALVDAGGAPAAGSTAIPIEAIAIAPSGAANSAPLPEAARSSQPTGGETAQPFQPVQPPTAAPETPLAAASPLNSARASAPNAQVAPVPPTATATPNPFVPSPAAPTSNSSTPAATPGTAPAAPPRPATPTPIPSPAALPRPAPSAPSPAPAPSPVATPGGSSLPGAAGSGSSGGEGGGPPAPGSGHFLAALVGEPRLADTSRDVPDQLARWQSSPEPLQAINYLAPLGLTLQGDLVVEVVVAINRDGQVQVFPETARAIQGQASSQQAGQLAARIIGGWRFSPTQMGGEPVMQDYVLRLKLSALGG